MQQVLKLLVLLLLHQELRRPRPLGQQRREEGGAKALSNLPWFFLAIR